MSLLSSVLGFQHRIRTPVGYAPGVTSALHLGYGSNSKITGGTITKSLDIVRDGDAASVSAKVRNKEATGLIDLFTTLETNGKVISDDLNIAKDSFKTVIDNLDLINDIVTSAEAGVYSPTELDDQQVVINDLVSEIQTLLDETKVDGMSVFDGSFTSTLQVSSKNNENYNIDLTDINIAIDSTSAQSLGDTATKALDQISITTNTDFESVGGANSLADATDLSDMEIFKANALKMEAKLNSVAGRSSREVTKITDKRTAMLNEFFATLDTSNGGKNSVVQDAGFFYHPSALPITTLANYNGTLLGNIVGSGVQGASAFSASSLLP